MRREHLLGAQLFEPTLSSSPSAARNHLTLWPQFLQLEKGRWGFLVFRSACNPVGSLFHPAPRPALLGLLQPALAGCQSPGGGDQLVGAQGLEKAAPGAGVACQ